MVLDAAYVAGTIASFLMNGACCMYQVNREEGLKEELREEIKKEWIKERKRELRRAQKFRQKQMASFEDVYDKLLEEDLASPQSYTKRKHLSGNSSSSGQPKHLIQTLPSSLSSKSSSVSATSSDKENNHTDNNDNKQMFLLSFSCSGGKSSGGKSQCDSTKGDTTATCSSTSRTSSESLESKRQDPPSTLWIARTASLLDEIEEEEDSDDEKGEEGTVGGVIGQEKEPTILKQIKFNDYKGSDDLMMVTATESDIMLEDVSLSWW